jgi:outer membrane protein OmpA-like peptidoglycan-associated protein
MIAFQIITTPFCSFVLAESPSVMTRQFQAGRILDWRQTALLEHEDRKKRFIRLTTEGFIATPVFYEDLISKNDLKSFGVDLPVLRLVFSQRVFFDTDKTELRPEASRILDLVADSLRHDVPDVALFIAGHTDSRGNDGYNYTLSVARADAVARSIFARGVGSAKLWRVGFGKAVPIKPNSSPRNMAENRRVEFLFAAKPEAIAVWLSTQAAKACGNAEEGVSECREVASTMSSVIATPILTDKREPISPLEQRTATSPNDSNETAAIDRESRVIIDLKERRVIVGRPDL